MEDFNADALTAEYSHSWGMNLNELLALLEQEEEDDDEIDENGDEDNDATAMNVQPLYPDDRTTVVPATFSAPVRSEQPYQRHDCIISSSVRTALGQIQPQVAAPSSSCAAPNQRDIQDFNIKKKAFSATKTLKFKPAGVGIRRRFGGETVFRERSHRCRLDGIPSTMSQSIKPAATFVTPDKKRPTRCYNGFPSIRLERVSSMASAGAGGTTAGDTHSQIGFTEVQKECELCGTMTKYFCFGCKRHFCLTSDRSDVLLLRSSSASAESDNKGQHPRGRSHLENYCGTFRTIEVEEETAIADRNPDASAKASQKATGAVVYYGINSCYHEVHYVHGGNHTSNDMGSFTDGGHVAEEGNDGVYDDTNGGSEHHDQQPGHFAWGTIHRTLSFDE